MIDFTKFGLAPEDTAATLIHPMCADQFTAWRDRASPAQKEWVTATGFAAKPGNAICFVGADGAIDFAIGIIGGHAIWDAAKIAATLPTAIWQLGNDDGSLSVDTIENLTLGWGLSQYRFDHYRPTKAETPNQLVMPQAINQDRLLGLLAGIYLCRDLINQPPNHIIRWPLKRPSHQLPKHMAHIFRPTAAPRLRPAFRRFTRSDVPLKPRRVLSICAGDKGSENHLDWQRHHL